MTSPIRNIELLKIFANAFVIWLVIMGFWPMNEPQQAATLTMLMALVNVAGAWWQNKETTPLAAPTDEQGVPLVRATDGMPTEAQTRSMSKK